MQKAIAVLFSLVLLGQCLVLRRRLGTWLFPATLFALFWFLEVFFPLVLLWPIPAEPLAVAYISVCVGAFAVGSAPFDWSHAYEINRVHAETRSAGYDTPFIKLAFYGLTTIVLVCIAIDTTYQGFALQDFVFNLLESSGQYAGMRYAEELQPNAFGQLSFVLTYVVVPLGGLVFSSAKSARSRLAVAVLSFGPSILVMLMQSAKGMLLLAIVLFYGGVLAGRIRRNNLTLVERGSIGRIVVVGAILTALVVLSFLSRGLYDNDDSDFVARKLVTYVTSYTSGHMYGFSDFFSHLLGDQTVNQYEPYSLSWGFYTFMAIFRALGSTKVVPLGYFDEYYSYGDILTTNIYTLFRGLIMDFGVVGSVVYMLLAGWLCAAAFHSLLTSRRPVVSVAFFIFMLGYMYTTLLISLFVWTSVFVSFALLCVVLWVNEAFFSAEEPAPAVSDPGSAVAT